ncbi:MAG: RNA polymerase sigma factor [Chloroflexi bacterium]|nr:RNA polymerase sigma factor [Chloroflexota bacterium]
MAEPEDALLVARIRVGDKEAYSVVVERYQGSIGRYLYRLVGDAALAEDLCQETFLRAYRALSPPQGGQADVALGPWLYRIASNAAISALRRRRLLSFLPFVERSLGGEALAAPNLEERDLVRRALARVPPDYAACLVLNAVEGYSYREIAEILGLSGEAVRKRIARGKAAFRKAYLALSGED